MKSTVADYQTLALCLRIVPVLGATVRLTRYPRNLTMSNGQVYVTGSGYDFSGYTAESTMAASALDLEGILGIAGIGRDQIASGIYDNARAYLFATSFLNPVEDEEPIVASILGKTSLLNSKYKIEEMALVDALGQSVGDTYTANCRKTLGGQEFGGCHVNLATFTVTGTVTGVTSVLVFRDSARTEAADWFGQGTITFTGGANAGLGPLQVRDYAADGTFTLYEPTYYPVAPGDAYSAIPGCRHRAVDCLTKYNNKLRFGGFEWVPTSSTYSKVGGA